jgi:hypothetical protein
MRVTQSGKLRLDWGAETLWQSPLPKSVFDGDTLHLFAVLAEVPSTPPRLFWEMDGQTVQAAPETISRVADGDLARLGGACRLEHTPNKKEALELALRYQLLSEHSSLFLVYQREGADKVSPLPQLQQVPQMMAAGYASSIYRAAIGEDFVVTRMRLRQIEAKALRKLRHPSRSMKLRAAYDEPRLCRESLPLDDSGSYPSDAGANLLPPPKEILAYFDAQALTTSNLSQTLKALLGHFPGLEGWNTLLSDLARQEGAAWEEAWAAALAFLAERPAGEFSLSRQGQRLLRVKNQALAAAVRNALTAESPDIFG